VIELRTLRRPFWTIAPDDVKVEKRNFGNGGQATVQKVSWRGGSFVRKFFKQECEFETELDAVLRISHPHVVHTFGLSISADGKEHSLLMELLDTDLFLLIEKKASSEPPFSREESIDILLQIAKAMTHVHGLAEPVIHGDLKPLNILVSQCEILGDVRQYLVKVADFGSAKILNNCTFSAEGWTTKYAAPELLEKKFFPERNVEIRYPKKIDVYSFGIIAFQVLTGLVPYEEFLNYRKVSSKRVLREGVISGELRPRLREACSRLNFWNDPALMALVESCWHHEPSDRPEFSEVTDRLESIYSNLMQVR
jgi:serine/threonine protein kinase